MPLAIQIVQIVWEILGPVAVQMVAHAMSGGDPLDVLRKESIDAILGEESRLDIAERLARARLSPSPNEPAPMMPREMVAALPADGSER